MENVTRYHLIGKGKEVDKYLAVYEFDTREDPESSLKSPEFDVAITSIQKTWQGGGLDLTYVYNHEPLRIW